MSEQSNVKTIELLPYQRRLLESKARHILMLCGIGAGKTKTLVFFLIKMAVEYGDKCKGLLVCPTYSQLTNATLSQVIETLEDLGIPHRLVASGSQKHLMILNHYIYLYSLENYNAIRGIEVGYIAADEIAFAQKGKESYDVCLGRLRDRRGPMYVRLFTSPNGFDFLYDQFTGKDVHPTSNSLLIKAKTKDNVFLPDSYYENLLELYGGVDSPLARQELFAEWVNLSAGAIYHAFNRDKHTAKLELDKNLPVYVGIDFNIDNMNLIYIQQRKEAFFVVKAVSLKERDANTFSAVERIHKDLKGYITYIIPDSTASARKTSSHKSDRQIIVDAGLTVLHTKNPSIRDRQNSVNLKFIKNNLFINSECEDLIKEIETLSARDEEGKVSHAAVALGYVVWHLAPLKLPKSKSKTIAI